MGDTTNEEHDPDALLSLAEASRLVGVHRTTLGDRIRHGRLQAKRIGRSYATTLRWLIESEKTEAPGPPLRPVPEELRAHVPERPRTRRKKAP